MTIKRERWDEIQQGEFEYHAAKDETKVLEHNVPYWRSLLASLPDEIRVTDDSRVLDLGCGGCGILLGLDHGRLHGVDPLMNRYLEKFPFLRERSDIQWIHSTAEEVEFDEPFDLIFSINALDHVYDPKGVVQRAASMLRPGGHFVLTMNTHNTKFFRTYYARLYRLIDSHHPHQFTTDDVQRLVEGLECVEIRDIDELWFPHAEGYYRNVLNRPVEDRRKWVRAALNPLKWPMGFCKFALDMPPHRKRPGQRCIYSNYLYVFRNGVRL